MKLIRPNTINDAALVSSSVAEDEYAAWSSETSYASGARCIKAHRIWESAQSGNLNHDPETAGSSWWVDMGATNRWKMFDDKVGTVTSAPNSIEIVLAPGRFDALALMGVDAAHATVTMRVGSRVVYERSMSLIENRGIKGWYQYFFEPIVQKDFVVLTSIPVFGEAETTITLTKTSGVVKCAMCVVGMLADLGETLSGVQLGNDDYSRVNFDDFGVATLIKRSFSKNMSLTALIDNRDVDRVHRIVSAVRATPVVLIGSEKLSSMVIFGIVSFNIDIKYRSKSACSFKVKGMI